MRPVFEHVRYRYLILLVAGAVMALAMPPFLVWPALFLGLAGFYALLAPLRGWRAALAGWVFGFGYFAVGLYWIGNALLVPGNSFKWVWPLAVLGLPVGLALFTAAAAWGATRFSDLKRWSGFALFAAMLCLSEWLRGTILTGFPWNLYAYGWAGILPLAQGVSVVGTYGLTLLTILCCALPGFLIAVQASRRVIVLALLGVIAAGGALYGWGAMRLDQNPTVYDESIMLRIVQPDIAQEDKWRGDKVAENLRRTVAASSAPFIPGKTYLIVWPETAITDFVAQDSNARAYIRENIFAEEDLRFLIAGVLRSRIDEDTGRMRHYNSLITYDYDMVAMATYDKAHLVPFGEYIPFNDIIPLQPFVRFSGFSAGPGLAVQEILGIPPFSGLICYEVIFPGKSVPAHDDRAAWIVNVTNDGWYGDSPGPRQHMVKAVYRAIEQGLPIARSANTGVSVLVDPMGRVLEYLDYGAYGAIDHKFPLAAQHKPLFTRYGNLFFWISIVLLCVPALIRKTYTAG